MQDDVSNSIGLLSQSEAAGLYFAIYRFATELFTWKGRGELIEWLVNHPDSFDDMVSCGYGGEFERTSYNYHMFCNFWRMRLAEAFPGEDGERSPLGIYDVPAPLGDCLPFLMQLGEQLGVRALADAWINGVSWEDISA